MAGKIRIIYLWGHHRLFSPATQERRLSVAEINTNGLKANSFHTAPTQLHSAKSAMSQMTHRFSLPRRCNQRGKSAYSLSFLRRCFFASTRLDCDLYLPWRWGKRVPDHPGVICGISSKRAWKIWKTPLLWRIRYMMNGRLFQEDDYVLRDKQPHGLSCGTIH